MRVTGDAHFTVTPICFKCGLNEKNLKEWRIEPEVLGPFQRDVDSYVVRCHFLRGIRAGDAMGNCSMLELGNTWTDYGICHHNQTGIHIFVIQILAIRFWKTYNNVQQRIYI